MTHNNFACMILTHGRADNVITARTLSRRGYTGRVIYVIDDEDEQIDAYRKNFGAENIEVFCKQDFLDNADTADCGGKRDVILPARNACFDIAKRVGLTHFLELDDDYTAFRYRYCDRDKLVDKLSPPLDAVFDLYLDFLDSTNILTVTFSQGGDMIGGRSAFLKYRWKRKAMNSFFCRTDRPFEFRGRINEDVNTYTLLNHRGQIMCMVSDIQLKQLQTQINPGGMSGTYNALGTYMKSFYSVLFCPSAVCISVMGDMDKRIHHKVSWEKCAPMILRENIRKCDIS